jgi:membrane protein required for colicin V production
VINLFDVLLVIVIAVSVIAGFIGGFARVGIHFLAMLAGIVCGFWFYGVPAAHLAPYMNRPLANVLGFLAVLFAFLLVGSLVAKLAAKLFRWVGLSWLDRLAGGAFGLVRGVFIAIAFVTVLTAFKGNPPPKMMVESQTLPYVLEASNWFAACAPYELKEAFNSSWKELRTIWKEHLREGRKKAAGKVKAEEL